MVSKYLYIYIYIGVITAGISVLFRGLQVSMCRAKNYRKVLLHTYTSVTIVTINSTVPMFFLILLYVLSSIFIC